MPSPIVQASASGSTRSTVNLANATYSSPRASLLRNRHLSLDAFFKDRTYAQLWTGNIARNLLDYIYKQQLDATQRKLLFAFSIYREPVPLDAAQFLLEGNEAVSKVQVQADLDVLLSQHLLQAAGEGSYQLHAERLQVAHIYNNLGVIYRSLGRNEHARDYLERALRIYEKEGDRVDESWSLNHLGRVYAQTGNKEQARQYYEQALKICEEEGDHLGEAAALNNIGRIYGALGDKEQEQQYYEQALSINREIGDRLGEAASLNNLGRVLDELGQQEKAREDFEQALGIFKEVGGLRGQGWSLNNLGKVYSTQGQQEQALKYLEQALRIRREVDRRGAGRTLNNLGNVYMGLGRPERALKFFEEALSINREMADREGEGKTLRNIGIFYFKQHNYAVALAALLSAGRILDEAQSAYRSTVQEWIDALRKEVGEEQFVALREKVESQADKIVAQALM